MDNNKPVFSLSFVVLSVLFCVLLIVSNLIEIKTVDAGWFSITAGFIVFPLSYILNDCIVEVYGFRKARLVIWLGFAMSLMAALFLNVAIWLPGGADWHGLGVNGPDLTGSLGRLFCFLYWTAASCVPVSRSGYRALRDVTLFNMPYPLYFGSFGHYPQKF